MIQFLRKIGSSQTTLILLLLINISVQLCNFKIEEFDIPQATKKLIVNTIKNELVLDKNKEVKNLENILKGDIKKSYMNPSEFNEVSNHNESIYID